MISNKVKQLICKVYNHPSYFAMTYNRAIPSVVKTLKKIRLNSNLYGEFSTKFYNEKVMSLNISLVCLLKFCQ